MYLSLFLLTGPGLNLALFAAFAFGGFIGYWICKNRSTSNPPTQVAVKVVQVKVKQESEDFFLFKFKLVDLQGNNVTGYHGNFSLYNDYPLPHSPYPKLGYIKVEYNGGDQSFESPEHIISIPASNPNGQDFNLDVFHNYVSGDPQDTIVVHDPPRP